jgi:polyhydroxybutyrate depolymerase
MKKRYYLIIASILIHPMLFSQGLGVYHQMTVMVDSTVRDYILYEPPGHILTEPWPVVFNFHGLGGTPAGQVGCKMFEVSDTAGFFIVYPKGLPVTDIIFGGPVRPGWNVPGAYWAPHDDVVFVNIMIDSLVSNNSWAIDTNRIHATGVSNGAEFSLYLACALSDRIASVGDVAGQMTYEFMDSLCSPSRSVSVLHMLGTNDPCFPVNGNSYFPPLEGSAVYWAQIGNCDTIPIVDSLPDLDPYDGSTVTLKTYGNCDEFIEVLCYRIEGGGHCWPGGVDPCNNDINASVELWEFFNRNPMPDTTSTGISSHAEKVQTMVYPNPVVHELNISGIDETGLTEITIYNQLGQRMLYLKHVELPVDVSILKPGLYVIEIISGERRWKGKFIK